MSGTTISKKQIQHLAELARLKLTEGEKKELQKDLKKILDYVAKLNEPDTKSVLPMSGGTILENRVRKDVVILDRKPEKNEILGKILKNAPELEKGFFRVPGVFD